MNLKNSITSRSEYFLFYIIFIGGVVVNYLIPSNEYSFFYFYILLFFFFISKRDYFWFALLLFFLDAPGGFFPPAERNYGLPMLTFPFYINFQEVFIYLALIKAILKKVRYQFVFAGPVKMLFFYALILMIISIPLGMSYLTFSKSIKWMLPYTLLYSVPKLISEKNDWIKFFSLIFPIVFISIFTQILHLILQMPPALLLGRDFISVSGEYRDELNNWVLYSKEFAVYRLLGSYFVSFLSLAGALFYLVYKENTFSKNYLISVIIFAIITITLSATRGLILALFISLLYYSVAVYKSPSFYLRIGSIFFIAIIILLFIPIFRVQLIGVFTRFETILFLFEGDYSAGGTLGRLDTYTPFLLKKFSIYPLFGWGFTDEFWEFSNPHAGIANLLAQVGIFGTIVFGYFIVQLISLPNKVHNKLLDKNPYKKSIKALVTGAIVLIILHSTSGQQFLFLIGFYNFSFTQLILYAFMSNSILSALTEDKSLRIVNNAK